jgi:pyridoxal biosynthesis lyase PdxS
MLGIFKSGDPEKRARAIVHAVAHFRDGKKLAEVSYGYTSVMMMKMGIIAMMMIMIIMRW